MDTKDTLLYYNQNAKNFISTTINVSFSETQDKFLKHLPQTVHILDFGCGSGRDTKYFLEKGYKVDATDGSSELCKYATEFTGIKVEQMLFQELDSVNTYDGIWACSSLLHLSKQELNGVIPKMIVALKSSGIIYTSFKYGQFEGERNGRYFTDFTIEEFNEFIKEIKGIELEEYWITDDVRADRENEKWLNIILRRI